MADHSFEYPVSPDQMEWHHYFPSFFPSKDELENHDDSHDQLGSSLRQVGRHNYSRISKKSYLIHFLLDLNLKDVF